MEEKEGEAAGWSRLPVGGELGRGRAEGVGGFGGWAPRSGHKERNQRAEYELVVSVSY